MLPESEIVLAKAERSGATLSAVSQVVPTAIVSASMIRGSRISMIAGNLIDEL